jgi:hypothetical protein
MQRLIDVHDGDFSKWSDGSVTQGARLTGCAIEPLKPACSTCESTRAIAAAQ